MDEELTEALDRIQFYLLDILKELRAIGRELLDDGGEEEEGEEGP
ncbi:MAG: hypothetical protein WD689_08745 [Gaiellaceae bacterium]